MTYTNDERRKLDALQKRRDFLAKRTEGRPDLSYDAAELSALRWALEEIDELRGLVAALAPVEAGMTAFDEGGTFDDVADATIDAFEVLTKEQRARLRGAAPR